MLLFIEGVLFLHILMLISLQLSRGDVSALYWRWIGSSYHNADWLTDESSDLLFASSSKYTRYRHRIRLPTTVLGTKLIFVTGLVKFVTAVARLVCPDQLG